MTDGPIVRLARAVQYHNHPDDNFGPLQEAFADLAGPCETCPRSCGSVEDAEGEWHLCPTCNGTGTDPLALAREADRLLGLQARLYLARSGGDTES